MFHSPLLFAAMCAVISHCQIVWRLNTVAKSQYDEIRIECYVILHIHTVQRFPASIYYFAICTQSIDINECSSRDNLTFAFLPIIVIMILRHIGDFQKRLLQYTKLRPRLAMRLYNCNAGTPFLIDTEHVFISTLILCCLLRWRLLCHFSHYNFDDFGRRTGNELVNIHIFFAGHAINKTTKFAKYNKS